MTEDAPSEDRWSILVVEDHPATRRLLEMRLRKAGYRVISAGNGREALACLERDFCPLVLTDWKMPEMNGLTLCRAIRQRDRENYIYVIFLTVRDSLDDVVMGLEAGADDYLTKPVHPMELLARLQTGRRILELERTLKERNQEIARLAITDPLTGVYNRRYLSDQLPREIRRALRYGRPLGLIICDLDRFKCINDVHGHGVGDLVLQEFADWLKSAIRPGVDWLARYGGEEFALVLPETDLAGAYAAAERFRRLVAEKVVVTESGPIAVTASFGVSCCISGRNEQPLIMETFLAEADQFMYQAKRAGRNRVMGPTLTNGLRGAL